MATRVEVKFLTEGKLKPCPFCGSKNVEMITDCCFNFTNYHYVLCYECHAQSDRSCMELAKAIENWNKRAGKE